MLQTAYAARPDSLGGVVILNDRAASKRPLPSTCLDTFVPDTESLLVLKGSSAVATEMPHSLWYRQKVRRATILSKARGMISREGSMAISVRKLAANCQLAPQTLYNLVGDRDYLLREAIVQYLEALIDAARALQGPPGFFMAFVDVLAGHAVRNPDYVRAVAKSHLSAPGPITDSCRVVMKQALLDELTKLQERGHLREHVDIVLLSESMQWQVRSAAISWVETPACGLLIRRQLSSALGFMLVGALRPHLRQTVEEWTDAIQASE